MNLDEIERELGASIADAVLTAALSVISDDPTHSGYQRRLDALEALLTITLALTALRGRAPTPDMGDRLAHRVRDAVALMRRRDVAMQEMGALDDVPLEWRRRQYGHQRTVKRLPSEI